LRVCRSTFGSTSQQSRTLGSRTGFARTIGVRRSALDLARRVTSVRRRTQRERSPEIGAARPAARIASLPGANATDVEPQTRKR